MAAPATAPAFTATVEFDRALPPSRTGRLWASRVGPGMSCAAWEPGRPGAGVCPGLDAPASRRAGPPAPGERSRAPAAHCAIFGPTAGGVTAGVLYLDPPSLPHAGNRRCIRSGSGRSPPCFRARPEGAPSAPSLREHRSASRRGAGAARERDRTATRRDMAGTAPGRR
jgi:hypothetical protein